VYTLWYRPVETVRCPAWPGRHHGALMCPASGVHTGDLQLGAVGRAGAGASYQRLAEWLGGVASVGASYRRRGVIGLDGMARTGLWWSYEHERQAAARLHDMITVYKFGTPSRVVLPDGLREQLRMAHDLREDLVTLEHAREAAVRAVWSAYPQVAAAEEVLAAAEADAVRLVEAVAVERRQSRSRTVASSAALMAARAEVKAARTARKAAVAAISVAAETAEQAVIAGHRAAVKATYADYVQTRGLYWATWNDVTDRHRVAVSRVFAARKAGRPAELRHHRWDGSGRLTVQLQRLAADPPRSPDVISEGAGKWRNTFRLPWTDPVVFTSMSRADQRRAGRGVALWAYGAGRHAELPVIVHRMLPADADITGAQLVVRRVAGGQRVTLSVTARVADPSPVFGGPQVAVHVGWRRLDGAGAVRVAVWRADSPVDVPDTLRDVVRVNTDRSGTVVLPARWRDDAARPAVVQSSRDVAFEQVKARVVGWLGEHDAPIEQDHAGVDYQVAGGDVARWRSPGRLVGMARRWATLHEGRPMDEHMTGLLADVEAWRRSDRRVWETQAHGRDKTIGRRDDAWRRFAAWVAGMAGELVLDDTDLAAVARRSDPDESSVPAAVAAVPGRQRVDAAPGGLRDAVRAAAAREGVTVTVVSHAGLTRTHARCGHVNPVDDRYGAAAAVPCDGCGEVYDQDYSATVLMLGAASAAGRLTA